MEWILRIEGFVLLAGVVGVALNGLAKRSRRRRGARLAARARREAFGARIDAILRKKPPERQRGDAGWSGYRKFRISAKTREADGVASFVLTPFDGKPIAPFRPGQYLTFQVNVPGVARPLVRCYSLSDAPRPAVYRVTIKKILPPPGKTELSPGLVSSVFHDQMQVGDALDVKAPSGQFFLDPGRTAPIVLLAGGIGITPLLSMLNAVIESGSGRSVRLFYGVRNASELIQRDHLEMLAREHPNFRLRFCFSDDGKRVSVAELREALPPADHEFYLCGPPPMMEQLHKDLLEWGIPTDRIFFERFGPASVKTQPATAPSAAAAKGGVGGIAGIEVTFVRSKKTLLWQSGGGSLLECAESVGITLESGCRAGNCGTCLTPVLAGEVDYLTSPGSPPGPGNCLACIAVPKANLTIDA